MSVDASSVKGAVAEAPAKAQLESVTVDNKENVNTASSQTNTQQFGNAENPDVRVAVVGNVDSGKSTLIGVLTSGGLDNGRGLARSRVFVHRHEASNGRTSSVSQHILGFDEKNEIVHQPASAMATAAQKNKAWRDVVKKSRSILTLIDLAGHERYLKTTIAGLTGCVPDYALVIVGANMGITKMTKEHLGVCIALDIPVAICISKVDMCPPNVLERTKNQLFRILKSPAAGKMPFHVRSEKDVSTVLQNATGKVCPVFFMSSVTGEGLSLVKSFLSQLKPLNNWVMPESLATEEDTKAATSAVAAKDASPVEYNIDETFVVTGVGLVVSGTVTMGVIKENTILLLGPFFDGSFRKVLAKTIHCKRTPVTSVVAGTSAAVALKSEQRKWQLRRSDIRRGMVLVHPDAKPEACWAFTAQVHVLHHPTTIKRNYQAVIHCGMIRQTAELVSVSKDCLRTGDRAEVRFHFLQRPEYMHNDRIFIFREGNTKGMGKILKVDLEETGPARKGRRIDAQARAPRAPGTQGGSSAAAPRLVSVDAPNPEL